MNDNAGPYTGMDRYACRKAIVADFEKEGLLVKIEPYHHTVGHCQRCDTIIEPRISTQWFVRTKAMAEQAMRLQEQTGIRSVGLTGGVFQNRVLAEASFARLEAAGFAVHLPRRIPVNDAGLSFGQVIEYHHQ